MTPGIEFELIWKDDDLLEVRVVASNTRFHASAHCYTGHGAFAELAGAIAGFSRSVDDKRSVDVGTLDPAYAHGGVRLSFRCSNSAGHVVVDLEFLSEPVRMAERETASFSIEVEPAAIDLFVEQLRQSTDAVDDVARLNAEPE